MKIPFLGLQSSTHGPVVKTWARTLKEDLGRLIVHAVVGIRRRCKEWAPLAMDLAQDRRAWSAAVRDAVNAMDTDSARAGLMSSQVQVHVHAVPLTLSLGLRTGNGTAVTYNDPGKEPPSA